MSTRFKDPTLPVMLSVGPYGEVMRKFESLGQYHDSWGWILLSAPDKFNSLDSEPVNQAEELRKAFDDLRSNFYLTKKNIKDDRLFRIAQELLEMAYEAYVAGDIKTGAHALQECEGLVWKSRSSRIKYAVEAERRVFGENITYAGAIGSQYPYEGTKNDLGSDQLVLLEIAKKYVELYLSRWRDFSFFCWVMENDGTIKRISSEPKEDESLLLKPVQKSLSACRRHIKTLAEEGQIRACVLMNIIGPQGDGLVSYDIEQVGSPHVSARQLFKLQKGPSHQFEAMRYHLDESEYFHLNG